MTSNYYYKLNDDNSISPAGRQEFAEGMNKRQIKKSELPSGTWVSTIFLGTPHNFDFDSCEPVLFETMAFDSNDDELHQERHTTYDKAMKGHERVKEMAIDKEWGKSKNP